MKRGEETTEEGERANLSFFPFLPFLFGSSRLQPPRLPTRHRRSIRRQGHIINPRSYKRFVFLSLPPSFVWAFNSSSSPFLLDSLPSPPSLPRFLRRHLHPRISITTRRVHLVRISLSVSLSSRLPNNLLSSCKLSRDRPRRVSSHSRPLSFPSRAVELIPNQPTSSISICRLPQRPRRA